MAGLGTAELRTPGKEKEEGSKVAKVEKSTMAEILMKDARALRLIQSAVSDQIFPRIVNEETSKGAWDILKQEFRGDKQVRSVKLQGLRREFEYTRMKDSEPLSVYIAKLFDLINQMKSYGEELPRERVVQKLLISLPKSYDSICFVIEHSKDLDTLEIQEVVASLKGFELRLDRHTENSTEKAFTSLNIESKSSKSGSSLEITNLRRTGSLMERIGVTGPILILNQMHQMKEPKHPASTVRNYTIASVDVKLNNSWYVDSGCNNHMTGDERLLVDIRRDANSKVKMGTGETVQVAGKGTLVIDTIAGRKHIQEVMLVPGLEENLLSVGQMMEHGNCLIFGKGMVTIFDDWSLQNPIAKVQLTSNRCFPLTMEPATQLVLKASVTHILQTWHKRLGHLNDQSIRLLANQGMVHGLPSLEKDFEVCEGCKL
ncbi:hypothetical protein L3X38_000477 [Prunus dulcis]|uniref:GAG-pre-integrase domain-containing protein n=1 Tax=Prunus dulcis TaxID=3755 RepID=A0AAD4ZIY7_PRUDU|nr:hypothetical protein L3X38_000477 [Prunus dulcis]